MCLASADRRDGFGGAYGALAHCSTEAFGQPFGHVFAAGVVDDLFGLDHLARHEIEVSELIGQAQFDGLLTVQNRPLKVSGDSLRRLPRPAFTTSMNCLCT